MKRVIAYIDGYNLYYGLLKGTPYKWLDLVAFVRAFLRSDQELVAIKYFTAPIKTHPHGSFSVNLKTAASYYKNIPRDLPAKCQLPDVVEVGTHGHLIHRPAAWS